MLYKSVIQGVGMTYFYNKKSAKGKKPLPPELEGKVEFKDGKWLAKELKERISYPQDWHNYNQYQTSEKLTFYKILNESVDSLVIDEKVGQRGRPFHLARDIIKCCCVKIFCGFSSRRTISELKLFQKLGYLRKVPSYNSLIDYFNNPEMEKCLTILYRMLALPLKNIEKKFSIDATGFSTSVKTDWVAVRFGKETCNWRDWKKLHIVCGVNSNIIVSASITKGYAHDSPEFNGLVTETSKNFKIDELSGDPAYLSKKNVDLVYKLGGIPYILPKSNTTGKPWINPNWKRMIKFWKEHKEEFLKHYHLRSNVESTFSMMKRKFSDHLRSKKDQAQRNELLCIIICHNLSVLVSGIFELGIDLNFEKMEVNS